ncbi:FapA family protein [Neiella marina]|uniref:FapA family protein n=1 Tax=Neiella holothuriorum TaxID=2870530 RepID=A0ABS7EKN2_9GAMM|nr:FapA family protein [Neiella holothuriorum]MBW8192917.1 FapA family protein [Neiella holothuriorum]
MSNDKLLRNIETNNVELHMQLSRLQQANLDEIIVTLGKSKYATCLFEPAHLYQLLTKAQEQQNDPAIVIIGQSSDAELTIEIEGGGMSAVAELRPAAGGKSLSHEDVVRVIAKAGIKHGLNPKAVDILSEHSKPNKKAKKIRCTIAKATMPVYGRDGRLEQLTPTLKDRVLRPQATGSGNVDPRDFGAIISVDQGAPLMRRIPSILGKDGISVTGAVLPAPPVKHIELKADEGSELKDGDENTLVANRLGIPVLTETGMKVVDTLEVEAVDNRSGHIEYRGSVVVKYNVAESMHITVGGDVLVMGNIEGCIIEAEGDITIEGGAYGHISSDHQYNCQIKAQGDVVVGMAQNVHIVAGKNIHVKKQALHCHLDCNESAYIGIQQPNDGTLIGGRALVGKGLYCGELGATAGVPTTIDLSNQYQIALNELEFARQQLADEQQALTELASEMAHIKEQPQSAEIQVQLEMCQSFFRDQKQLVEAREFDVQVAQSKLSRVNESVEVVVAKKLFSRIDFSLGSQWALSTSRDYGPSKVFYQGNSLQLEPHNPS